ncbi:MAG: hypothetical protein A2289_24050 [Deltaproteobacteria bacterium RIFOXYA12_FULL_58_15]|nr:MAG: hypothetical protein A2289_24050 [Deltaproteobacteria bacterium RIFOXYA12_FULL_58_15]OGR10045.1 MAG: hypothetical protein A2341_05380 [Deltaproteobacteria bacterium RIFOXYB12_FULL_58_9]
MEERIIRLETTVAFNEQTLAELNDFVSAQQMQLQELAEELRRLGERVRLLTPSDPPSPKDEPPPPHY